MPILPAVAEKFNQYPAAASKALLELRAEIYQVATEYDLGKVEESLKWGEASYSVKGGSPVRIDWKENCSTEVNVYFHCQTRLVSTFREVYPDVFTYEGNRAFRLPIGTDWPVNTLRHCLSMALRYHALKHMPLLGA